MPVFITSCDVAFSVFLITEGVAALRLKLLHTVLQPPVQAGQPYTHMAQFYNVLDSFLDLTDDHVTETNENDRIVS